jgi:homocysteine S-methyltransferase
VPDHPSHASASDPAWQRWRALLAGGPCAIDGGLATHLEQAGHSLNDSLWSARIIADDLPAVVRAHRDFINAGARVVISASYQVSRAGFISAGRTAQEADDALVASIAAARMAADGAGVLVAASIGPFGAISHDGAEYRGNYGLSHNQLVDFHAQRLAVIAATKPDLFAMETIPDVVEAAAIAEALADHGDIPAWMSFSCADERHTAAGQSIGEAVSAATQAPSVAAVGVNCVAPGLVSGLLEHMREVTAVPLVAYPNAGAAWLPETGTWADGGTRTRSEADISPRLIQAWVDRGAALIGGCCQVEPEAIASVSAHLRRFASTGTWHSS